MAGDDFFMELLEGADFRSEVASEGEVAKPKVEIVARFASGTPIAARRGGEGSSFAGHFLAERVENFGLLGCRDADKIFAEKILRASIHSGETRQKMHALFVGIPIGKNVIYEFVDAGGFSAWRFGFGDHEFGHSGDSSVLMGIEDFQLRRGGKAGMNFAACGEEFAGDGRKNRAQSEELEGFTAIHEGPPEGTKSVV